MRALDIVANVISDAIFVGAIAVIVWLANKLVYRRRLDHAMHFFNYDQDAPIRIFVSAFEHSGVKTRAVVNALELESAILLRDAIRNLSRRGAMPAFVAFLSRLIGKEATYPEPIIEPAPIEKVGRPIPYKSVVLIGGPVANNLASYYSEAFSASYKFGSVAEKYQSREGTAYRDVDSSRDLAVIEKLVNDGQVVVMLHGFGEEQTARAVRYLIERWSYLYKKHGTNAFAIPV